jgi:hypothetical protein
VYGISVNAEHRSLRSQGRDQDGPKGPGKLCEEGGASESKWDMAKGNPTMGIEIYGEGLWGLQAGAALIQKDWGSSFPREAFQDYQCSQDCLAGLLP